MEFLSNKHTKKNRTNSTGAFHGTAIFENKCGVPYRQTPATSVANVSVLTVVQQLARCKRQVCRIVGYHGLPA